MYHQHPDIMHVIRERIMAVDFSWENSIAKYIQVYRRVGAYIVAEQAQKSAEPVEETPISPPADTKTPVQVATGAPQEVESQPAPKAKTTVKKTPPVAPKKAPPAKAPAPKRPSGKAKFAFPKKATLEPTMETKPVVIKAPPEPKSVKKTPAAKVPAKPTPVPAKPAAPKKATAEKAPQPEIPAKPSPGKSQKPKLKK